MGSAEGEPDGVLILALDTSGDVCSLALTDGPRELTSVQFRHQRRLSERLTPLIEFILRDYGVTIRDVEALAVGLGPGSFTGVRVGVTMAKTLALALNRSVIGVCSLDALVEPLAALGPFVPPIVAVTPTRRVESVAAFYQLGDTSPIADPEVMPNAEIAVRAMRALGVAHLLVVGENADAICESVPPEMINMVNAVSYVAAPTALSVARLAWGRLEHGESDDADTLVPLYVTPTPVG